MPGKVAYVLCLREMSLEGAHVKMLSVCHCVTFVFLVVNVKAVVSNSLVSDCEQRARFRFCSNEVLQGDLRTKVFGINQ